MEEGRTFLSRVKALCVILAILSCLILFSFSEICYGYTNQNLEEKPEWLLLYIIVLLLILAFTGLYLAIEYYGRNNRFPIDSVGSEWYIFLFIPMPLFGSMLVYFLHATIVCLIIIPIEIILAILVLRGADRWYNSRI